jgi:hypothetical protein
MGFELRVSCLLGKCSYRFSHSTSPVKSFNTTLKQLENIPEVELPLSQGLNYIRLFLELLQ